jgi:glycosyltransferase involved in cell wall biosynthesis
MTQARVLYAVTDPITAISFLRGHLAFLKSEGFEPHLACARTPEAVAFARAECVTLHDVPLSRCWFGMEDLLSLVRAVRVLRLVRPTVLNYSTPKAALVWAVASWFARPPVVVFLLRGLRLEGERPWRAGFALLWFMELIAARSANVIVCVSEGLRRRAIGLRVVASHRSVVLGAGSSNGVDTERFSPITAPERRRARDALGLPDAAFVVGYVGRLARDKGLEDLMDAVELCAADVRHLRCVLVGASEPGFDLDHALASRPAAAAATLTRPATTAVEEEYAAFDVFVLPSRREGLSNALLEAQARALPCVTTDATGCVDAIEPGQSGFVVPAGDPHALASAIARFGVPRDAGLARRMGAAGRQRVERLFQPHRLWREYAELYRRSAAEPTRQRSETSTSDTRTGVRS